jgi:hypothetical protein
MWVILRKHSIFDVSFIRPSPDKLLVSWLIPLLEGILFAALAFARGRRYAFSAGRLSLWTAIAVAFGPLGFALMLSLLEWPAFEKCPECGRDRLATREAANTATSRSPCRMPTAPKCSGPSRRAELLLERS